MKVSLVNKSTSSQILTHVAAFLPELEAMESLPEKLQSPEGSSCGSSGCRVPQSKGSMELLRKGSIQRLPGFRAPDVSAGLRVLAVAAVGDAHGLLCSKHANSSMVFGIHVCVCVCVSARVLVLFEGTPFHLSTEANKKTCSNHFPSAEVHASGWAPQVVSVARRLYHGSYPWQVGFRGNQKQNQNSVSLLRGFKLSGEMSVSVLIALGGPPSDPQHGCQVKREH